MKKYIFTWYNHRHQCQETELVMAKDLNQAKITAVLVMQSWCGKNYTVNDIDSINELKDCHFYTIDKIKEIYASRNMKLTIPKIKESEGNKIGKKVTRK